MANENKKINELVSDDDDPTAELEILSLRSPNSADAAVERESDANTYGFGKSRDAASADGQSIPELKSDLEARTKTIGRLQYDIEQLRSKWLGLEREISAREEIASDLSREVDEYQGKLARKDKLLKKRDKEIESLKSEVKQRDESQGLLEQQRDESYGLLEQQRTELESQLEELRLSQAELAGTLEAAGHGSEKLRAELNSAQDEVTSLKADIEQRDEAHGLLEQQHTGLELQLAEQRVSEAEISNALDEAQRESEKLGAELATANDEIASLKVDIEQRDKSRELLEQQQAEVAQELAEQRAQDTEHVAALEEAARDLEGMRSQLAATQNQTTAEIALTKQISTATVEEFRGQLDRADKYADSLRHKMQDFIDSQMDVSKERDHLNQSLEQMADRNRELTDEIGFAGESIAELQKAMEQQRAEHEQEIRTLRFELSEAQETASESSAMNTQLASELMDSHGFKDELERRLQQNEEKAQSRVDKFEKQIRKLKTTGDALEQKLETKASAINVLLGELTKKTEQIESLGEIEGVIQDIDDRMSGHIDDAVADAAQEPETAGVNSSRDRVTRVLIGTVGDKELRFPLFKDRLTIGRTHENDIQLKSAYVSRRHAVVVTEGDNARVVDWGSKNGVFVNSKRVKEHSLSNGDVVSVGNTEFRYEERQKRDA